MKESSSGALLIIILNLIAGILNFGNRKEYWL